MLDVGTDLDSCDKPFDDYNDNKIEYFLLGDSLVSTDGKVVGSDDGIILGSTYDKVLLTVLGDVN